MVAMVAMIFQLPLLNSNVSAKSLQQEVLPVLQQQLFALSGFVAQQEPID